MKISQILFLFFLSIFQITTIYGADLTQPDYQQQCLKDLDFVRKHMIENSAPFKNVDDHRFKNWVDKGYEHTKELIEDIQGPNDCYYVMKFYLNGFDNSYISLRGYTKLPAEKYPGFLTAKYGDHHVVIYLHPGVSYLKKINVGDKVTHINDRPIAEYFQKNILPFYANDNSEFTLKAASIYNFIVDGNPFIPIPLTATFEDEKGSKKIDLKYTDLTTKPLLAARNIRQPDPDQSFKVKMISNGVWISIPSFYLSTEDSVFFTGMLSKLKELAKEDYILFDLRGNKGGAAKWSRPIIRNLWGDDYLKTLGKNHDYNEDWIKKIRVSKLNFVEFKKSSNAGEIKSFANALKNGDDYFEKKWKIYSEDLNLYTNKDKNPFHAKIFVLTDHFCRSTCFAFVSELLQIPGVTHIGLPTAIQGSDSYARKVRSPSEHFDFFYPTEIRVYPNRNAGKSLIPSKIFNGDIRDETAVINWVLSITEGE
jgi:hypothetical protein